MSSLIAVDIDGVLVDHANEIFVPTLNALTGV